jgi:galactonate dehydratase
MKITRISTLAVAPKFLFVKIETDEGIVGYGECLPDKAVIQAAAVQSFEHYLIGQDPTRIVHHWQAMVRGTFWRGGPSLGGGISGIELALWDILGKSLGVPVWQLLGGAVRDRIRVYYHCGGGTKEELVASAKALMDQGFTGLKFNPTGKQRVVEAPGTIERAVERVRAVRETVGNEVDVMLDFHGRVSPSMAVILEEEMRPYRPTFIEEPVLPENVPALTKLATQFKTPIATGERLFTRWGFREILESGAIGIIQPDPCVAGGVFETRQIAAMAETYYVGLAPHNPYGPLNLAACLHVAAASPNFFIQEIFDVTRLGGRAVKQPFEVVNGYIELPTRPGLGIDLDEEYCLANPMEPQVDHGRWFFEDDGSVADW